MPVRWDQFASQLDRLLRALGVNLSIESRGVLLSLSLSFSLRRNDPINQFLQTASKSKVNGEHL